MRESRLSGRKREYFASNAATQPTAAVSNACAWAAEVAEYWTEQRVPSAVQANTRNGTSVVAWAAGGGGAR
jgi:hypothetical protein